MYCPNCNKEYEGKFCPECGTKLIEKPSASGFNLNLGDANAISGGVNLSDSHNVHNEDKSVHNTNNVSNVTNNVTNVAAQKTEIEILQEKKNLYLNECKRANEDNVLDKAEIMALEEYRLKIGLDKATADSILEKVRQMTVGKATKTDLNPIAKIKLKQLTERLQKNEIKALMNQIDELEPLLNKYDHDELQRKYYLVLSALKSEKCIERYESTPADNYWESFFTYLAYCKVGQTYEAEEILASMDRFVDYPEDNITLLAVAGALIKGENAEAKDYLSAVTGDYTPSLQRFVDSIYLILEPEMANEMGADDNTCAFYLVNFFNQEDPKERARKEAAAAEEEHTCYNKEKSENTQQKNYIWSDAEHFSEGLAAVFDGEYWGFVNMKNELVIPCEYDKVKSFHEGLCIVQYDGYLGVIDNKGNLIVDGEYDDMSVFHEGLCRVELDGMYGFIDKKGELVIPCQYEYADAFSEGLAAVGIEDNWGFIDKAGDIAIDARFRGMDCRFCEGLARVFYNRKAGFIDHNGREIIEFKYEDAYNFKNGFARVKYNGLYGIIDKQGKMIVPCKYEEEDISDFSEGLARIRSNGLIGYIDTSGNTRIPCQYEEANDFKEGYACVKVNGFCGFIDKTGNIVIPTKYEDADDFCGGLALIGKDDSYGYGFVNKNGEEIIPRQFYVAYRFCEGMALIGEYSEDGIKYGFISSSLPTVETSANIAKKTTPTTKPFSWSYADGVLIISGTGPMDKYRMPNRCPWRELREEIEEVVVEEGVTSVGQCAFYGCSKLEKVSLPTTLQSIDGRAFQQCCNLVDIVIPEGVSIIGSDAFDHCESLQSVLFPTSLEIIDDQAFWGCSMSSIVIPCGVKRIGYSAFAYCEQLEFVTLPMGLETINDSAFAGCSNLSHIELPHTVSEVGKDAFPEGCDIIKV